MAVEQELDVKTTELPLAQAPPVSAPLFGAIAMAVTFGVELMLTAFIACGRIARRTADRKEFSARAWALMHPERDLQIYVAGIALTLLIVTLICAAWIRLTRASASDRRLKSVAGAQLGLAALNLVAFLALIRSRLPLDKHLDRPSVGLALGAAMSLLGIAMFVVAAIDYRFDLSNRSRRWLAWIGPVLMGLSIIAQLLLAPAAVVVGVLIALAVIWYSVRARRRHGAEGRETHALLRSTILSAMAVGSFAIYLILLPAKAPAPTRSLFKDSVGYRACIPVCGMVLCMLLDVRWGSTQPRSARRRSQIPCDILVPLLLCATILVPPTQWMILTGSFLRFDGLHHWNYFALGPALAFAHGRALVTDVYSQYGVAWPYLFGVLRRLVKLTYANIVGCSITYGCVYFFALYIFLRLLLRDAVWAALGTILAVVLQLFCGLPTDTIIWNFPSSTMLRHPLDVWFFLVLLGHNRCGGRKWFAMAGAMCGLAVLFELDTGIDLLIVLCFYWMLHLPNKDGWQILRTWKPWGDLLGAAASAGAVWLIGMSLASRGEIVHLAFWSEYLEGLHNQAFSGLGLLPIANVSLYGIALFAGMLIIYFFAIGLAGARIWLKSGSEIDFFLGSISAYGLGLLLLFVGRSYPWNLFHTMIPLAVTLVLLLHNFRIAQARDVRWTSLPWILAAACLAILWTKPEFASYPSLVRSFLTHSPDASQAASLSPIDLGGFSSQADVLSTQQVVNTIKSLPARDRDVAVLDDRDTLLDYLSGRAPWSRYSSLFDSLLTRKMVVQTEQELLMRRPRFIVIRSAPPPKWEFADTWASFHRFVPLHYHLENTVGGYEFWRRGQGEAESQERIGPR